MTDMNTILGLGQDVSFEGKTYRIADDLEFSVQADFERWLKAQAMRSAMDVCGADQQEADQYRRLFFEDSLGGAYKIEGKIARRALTENFDAMVKLLHLLLEDGKKKAPAAMQHETNEKLAKKMLLDDQFGPWAHALCLVALGLNPTLALVMGMGMAKTRAETLANRMKQETLAEMKTAIGSMNSEGFSEECRNSLTSYLDSLGEGSTSSSGKT